MLPTARLHDDTTDLKRPALLTVIPANSGIHPEPAFAAGQRINRGAASNGIPAFAV